MLEGQFRKPFPEQIAAYRLRLGDLVPTSAWDDIQKSAHDRAFMVAGATQADLLKDLGAAVDAAIADGETLDQFRARFRNIVEDRGWHGWTGEGTRRGENWRARVIYRTNMATSYAAGRRAQLIAGNYPYWVYRHGGSENPRLLHLSWDGLVLPPDHPFWITHTPVNDWGCSCYVLGARSLAAARRLGGDPDLKLPDNWRERDPRTGEPHGIGKGWGYAPGATVTPTITALADKLRAYPALLANDVWAGVQPVLARHWPAYIADLEAGGTHELGIAGVLPANIVKALGGNLEDTRLFVRPGLVRGPKASRHLASGDALSEETWARLPALLTQPTAIYRDQVTGRLIYVIERGDEIIQIAIGLDQKARVRRETVKQHTVVSAFVIIKRNLEAKISSGRFLKLM